MGIKLADPDRLVVATMGDGSYMFANPVACHHVAEAHDIAVLTVVLNNAGYGAVRQSVLGLYPTGYAAKADVVPLTSLTPTPDFAQVARACRAHAETVTDGAELPAALARAIARRDGRAPPSPARRPRRRLNSAADGFCGPAERTGSDRVPRRLSGLAARSASTYCCPVSATRRRHDLAPDSTLVSLVVTMYLFGLGIGQVLYGPVADRFGRKPAVLAGLSLYAPPARSVRAVAEPRGDARLPVPDGAGAASPRAMSLTIARDRFSGDAMTRGGVARDAVLPALARGGSAARRGTVGDRLVESDLGLRRGDGR